MAGPFGWTPAIDDKDNAVVRSPVKTYEIRPEQNTATIPFHTSNGTRTIPLYLLEQARVVNFLQIERGCSPVSQKHDNVPENPILRPRHPSRQHTNSGATSCVLSDHISRLCSPVDDPIAGIS